MTKAAEFSSGLKPLGHCTTVLLAERIVLSSATTCAISGRCAPFYFPLRAVSPIAVYRGAEGGGEAPPERERDPDSFAHLINFAVSAESARYRRLSSRHRLRRRKRFTVHRASFHAGLRVLCHVPSVSRTRFRAFRNFSGIVPVPCF